MHFLNGFYLLPYILELSIIKHHSEFKNKGILIVKQNLPQKYISKGKALI